MKIKGKIERFRFLPSVYYQQSKLIVWVSAPNMKKLLVVESLGSADELARKCRLPNMTAIEMLSMIGKKCEIVIGKGMQRLSKIL